MSSKCFLLKDKHKEAQKDALKVQNVTGSALPETGPRRDRLCFAPLRGSTSTKDPFECGIFSDVPSGCSRCPPISLDVSAVTPVDVSVAHSHVVASIGGLEATSSTVMKDPIAAHMSPIHEGIHTSSFVERGAFSLRE